MLQNGQDILLKIVFFNAIAYAFCRHASSGNDCLFDRLELRPGSCPERGEKKRGEEKRMPLFRRSSSPDVKKLQQRRDVEGLLALLTDPADEIRARAADALGEIKDARAVDSLLALLTDPADDVRKSAARALGEIKEPRAVEPLIATLNDPANEIRKSAARALGEIKDARAVEPLIAALQDPAYDLRASAADALGEIKDARAVEPLLNLYFKERDLAVGVPVCKALGQIGGDRAVEALISVLEDQSTTEEHEIALARAARALEEIGDARAVEPLRAVQMNRAHRSFVREAAASALKQIKSSR
jgi:HEAT repeat protein